MPKKDRQGLEEARQERLTHQCGILWLEGKSVGEIAIITGQNRGNVQDRLRLCQDQWRERSGGEYDSRLAAELARIDHVERCAWQAWEASTKGTVKAKSTQVRQVVNKGTKEKPCFVARYVDAERVTEHTSSAGNPRFLAVVQQCVETRLRLMGALDGSVVNNNTQVNINWEGMLMGQEPGVLRNPQVIDGHTISQSLSGGSSSDGDGSGAGNGNYPSHQHSGQGGQDSGGLGSGPGAEDDPIEARIRALQPLEATEDEARKARGEDIPLLPGRVGRRGRQDDIMAGLVELPGEGESPGQSGEEHGQSSAHSTNGQASKCKAQ